MCDDVRKPWINLARRLQAAASVENNGVAILTINVLIDKDNNPLVWTSPECTKIEPRMTASSTLAAVVNALAKS